MNKISFYVNGNVEIITGTGMHEFPYHTHNCFMAGAILSGSGEFCINGKASSLRKKDCYIVPSDTGISIKPIRDFSYITICLKNELAAFFKKYKSDSYYYTDMSDHLLALVGKLQMQQIDELSFTNEIVDMFGLCRHTDTAKSEYIIKAVQYINESCKNKFDLNELAENVFLSKYYLIRVFKREMGITPKQYHQQCKVRKLKSMIFEFPQSSIAYDLSFSTQSHMDSVFKRYMGITLNDYISSMKSVT